MECGYKNNNQYQWGQQSVVPVLWLLESSGGSQRSSALTHPPACELKPWGWHSSANPLSVPSGPADGRSLPHFSGIRVEH